MRALTLRGSPVLAYHGLGGSTPAPVDDRDAKSRVAPGSFGRQLAAIRESGHRVVRLYGFWRYQAVCASLGWPAQPGGVVVHRVAVDARTTEARFKAILARQPWGYLPGVARAALESLPRRVRLKVRPHQLAAQALSR